MTDVLDLGIFADADGNPDMDTMLVVHNRLFIQLTRLNNDDVPPPQIAVVDLATEQLVDADPTVPGVQPIALQGTAPRFKMQVVPQSRQLMVSATGVFADLGGLERIDLDTLQSLGLRFLELIDDLGQDLGAFTMLTPDRGYLVFSTDIVLSSHLRSFTLSGGLGPLGQPTALFYFVPHIVYQPSMDLLYWPEPDGLRVVNATTGFEVASAAATFSGLPTDLALITQPPTVPTATTLGLCLMAIALLLAAASLLRRAKPIARPPTAGRSPSA